MNSRQDRPRLAARVSSLVGLGALAAVAMAARSQTGQPAPAPPAAPVVAVDTVPKDSASVTDSLAASDSVVAVAMTEVVPAPAPAPQGPPTWPVDPATGQTLINGEPVVGRVFIVRKTDGIQKYENIASQYVGEAMPPDAPIVGTSHTIPTLEQTRRIRGIMVQATLWTLDQKRSAVEARHYRPMTNGTQADR